MPSNNKNIKKLKTHTVFLGLGSNLGNRKKNLLMARRMLSDNPYIHILSTSSIIETTPVGFIHQPKFLNNVVKLKTTLTPTKLLKYCLLVERKLKRTRTVKWGPRTIDIDILLYETKIIQTKLLQIPHPEMMKREFVLKPLLEIDGFFVHPSKPN